MADLFQWLRELWAPRRRRPSSAAGLQADLRVRPLEERRLFHAGPLTTPLAGAVTQNTEPPVAATVTVDEHQNLVIRGSDASEAVAVRWDESHQELWISGAALEGEVPGARSVEGGVAISLAQFEGREIIFDLGDGADALALDWSAGASQQGFDRRGRRARYANAHGDSRRCALRLWPCRQYVDHI